MCPLAIVLCLHFLSAFGAFAGDGNLASFEYLVFGPFVSFQSHYVNSAVFDSQVFFIRFRNCINLPGRLDIQFLDDVGFIGIR